MAVAAAARGFPPISTAAVSRPKPRLVIESGEQVRLRSPKAAHSHMKVAPKTAPRRKIVLADARAQQIISI